MNIEIFFDTKIIENALEETHLNYRQYDPGWYLYRKLLKYKFDDKFSHEFIELAYVTLAAWNMNSRGAKLQEFEKFEKSIKKNKKYFKELKHKKLKEIENEEIQKTLEKLFFELNLVADGKPPLVTFSKTLHFFLPNLIAPIDRKYTIQFFYNNTNVPKTLDNQFDKFLEIEKNYSLLAKKIELSKYKNKIWNSTIPKIVDNIIIGYLKLQNK